MPNFPCEFDIPDDWLVEAGMTGFTPSAHQSSTSWDTLTRLGAWKPIPAQGCLLSVA
jgi:hypothetical protein